MDIFPEYLLKAIISFDIDKMENLGIYEVAPEDFALCEFVDTSKMELQKIVRDGLDQQWRGVHQHFHADAESNRKARQDARVGAAVALRLAQLGGRIGADSVPGEGSVFHVELPAAQGPASP